MTFATARPADMVLLSNPGAETGPGAPGWSGTPGFTTTAYGTAGEYPSPAVAEAIASGGMEGGGAGFFDPGTDPHAVLDQQVDLTRFGSQIATGEFDTLGITGWLGGWAGSPDTVDLSVTPLDAGGTPLGQPVRLVGPTAAERGNVTQLLQRSGTLTLPPSTRLLEVELTATGQPGLKNHGYADEIVLWLGHHYDPNAIAWLAAAGPLGESGVGRATVKLAEKPPTVRRDGRSVIVNPRARAHCPTKTSGCTATVVVRKRPHGAIIATKTISVLPGKTARPTAKLNKTAKEAILDGSRIPVTVTVSIDSPDEGIEPASKRRDATLQLVQPSANR